MKKLLALVLCATMTLSLAGCGEKATEDVAVTTTTGESTAEESTVEETTEQPEEEVEEEPTEEVQQPEAETEVEVEATEEVVEESKVEMVDFETWAKQEGNDEVCLVHWNEELGIQEIMPPFFESKVTYEIQDGDKFAVPYRSNIAYININGDSNYEFDGKYLELPLEKNQMIDLNLAYKDENGEIVVLFYAFK